MNKLQMLLTIGMSCLLLLVVACFQAGEEEARITEPCVPLPGSDVDPCERRPHWSVRTSASINIDEDRMPKLPYVVLNEIRGHAAHVPYGLTTPQFWVRGTFVPGSWRCALQRAFVGVNQYGEVEAYNYDVEAEASTYPEYDCFLDVKVHEYLNGDGPDRLPILVGTGWTDKMDADDDYIARIAPGGRRRSSLEGREFVFYVVRPHDISTGAWDLFGFIEFWDVQRREDGEVVVVAGWADIDDRFDYEFTLDEFSADVRTAMATFVEETGGRVDDDPNEYMLATDANLGSLLENLRTYGAYSVADITPVVAPTVPGETDPDPYGLMVSDAPVTASPEVPGGLEDTPTPVSALGDEPTATATSSTPESEESDE